MKLPELSPYPIHALDREKLKRLSQAGESVFEDAHNFYLPANVLPELFSPKKIAHIHRECLKLGATVDVAIYNALTEDKKYIPVHACTEIFYKRKRVIGPVLISLTHKIVTHPHIPAADKTDVVTQSIKDLWQFSQGIIIGMPQLKEGSFTHNVFTNPTTLGGLPFSDIATKKLFYFFGTASRDETLLYDPQFQKICSTIYSLWMKNLDEAKIHLSKYALDEHDYISKMLL